MNDQQGNELLGRSQRRKLKSELALEENPKANQSRHNFLVFLKNSVLGCLPVRHISFSLWHNSRDEAQTDFMMSSSKNSSSLPRNDKPGVDVNNDEATKESETTTSKTVKDEKKESQAVEKKPSAKDVKDAKAGESVSWPRATKALNKDKEPPSIADSVSNIDTASGGVAPAATTSKSTSTVAARGAEKSIETKSETKPTTTPIAIRTVKEKNQNVSTAPAVSKQNSDPKPDSSANLPKKERETVVPKPVVPVPTTASAVMTPKTSQQHSHAKPQHRYFVPNRQNQEEAVFKMVQNIFKLLETREYKHSI
jgi:hypothetical protein